MSYPVSLLGPVGLIGLNVVKLHIREHYVLSDIYVISRFVSRRVDCWDGYTIQ
jgi:hypothetical protein